MPPPKVPRLKSLGPRLARPFYTSILISASLATYALLTTRKASPEPAALIFRRKEDLDCRLVHQAEDQCAFVLANCPDENAGLLPYLEFYYCSLAGAQPVAFTLLAAWLGLLFTTIGIAASDFFSINLSTIAGILGLSESLAGVTFLAFGNGSPDVFSTFAAMGSNSGSMAVGELIGAAGFITAVVAGSMALVREFKVVKRTFVRDISFFILAAGFFMVALADGHLHLWECIVMVAFYIFYVMFVVGWHWWVTRRKKRWQKEAAARGHFYGATTQPADELEPYRDNDGDDEGEDTGTMGGDGAAESAPDISALERGPRIEVEGVSAEPDDDDLDRDLHVAAEMTSSMRINRPRGVRSRSYTTLGQIRPSFVGALEFRSVLASLQDSSNVRLAPMHFRRQSEAVLNSQANCPPISETGSSNALCLTSSDDNGSTSAGRDRARSHGTLPAGWTFPISSTPQIVTESPTSPMGGTTTLNNLPPPSRASTTKDGKLAPPLEWNSFFPAPGSNPSEGSRSIPPGSPGSLHLLIPNSQPYSSEASSPSLSPFPGFSDSPSLLTPHSGLPLNQNNASIMESPGYLDGDIQEETAKPVRWWPYSALPPPHVFLGTLFPTLQGWANKSVWDKFVSLLSVPSILLLVITLPVVETERLEENPDPAETSLANDEADRPTGPTVCTEAASSAQQAETEWQRYRRNTRSRSISPYSALATPGDPFDSLSPNPPSASSGMIRTHDPSLQSNKPGQQAPSPVHNNEAHESEEPSTWNRWLVAIQIFTGPLFTVFIVWANMASDLENSGKILVRLVLYSLLGSLVLLGLLLSSTSPNVRPRYHFLFCFLGFIISVAWISTVAGEVVGVLKAFGVILGISEAILGLTIFAVGNSLGDLVADITVARLGYPVMALAACFGGPMLNILLGIGIGGAWMTTKAANEKQHDHPDRPVQYRPYHIQVGGTLMISAVTLLFTLVFLLVAVPLNNWVMSRKIGWSLIAIWSVSTIVNLVFEATVTWSEAA